MLLIIEIGMFIAGLVALITGKLPSILFGGPKYKYGGTGARFMGLILLIPLPAAIFVGLLSSLLNWEIPLWYLVVIEILLVLGAGIGAMVIGMFIRQSAELPTTGEEGAGADLVSIEAQIAHKAQGSLIYALLGILGFTAIVVGPLAFLRAQQAMRMIDEHQVGEKHRSTAKLARTLAVIIFLFYSATAIFFFTFIMAN